MNANEARVRISGTGLAGGRHDGRLRRRIRWCARRSPKRPTRSAQDLWALVDEGPGEALNLTVNTQPVMLTAGVAVWRAWLEAGGPRPAVVAGHSLGEYSGARRRRRARVSRRGAAGALSRAGDAGGGAGGRGRAWRRSWASTTRRVAAACAEAAQGQVVEAVNFNAPAQIVIAGHKEAVERAIVAAKASGAKRARAAAGVGAVPQLAAEAGGRAARRAPRAACRSSAPAIPVIHNVDVAGARDAGRDPRRAGAAGGEPGALGRNDAGVRRRAA